MLGSRPPLSTPSGFLFVGMQHLLRRPDDYDYRRECLWEIAFAHTDVYVKTAKSRYFALIRAVYFSYVEDDEVWSNSAISTHY